MLVGMIAMKGEPWKLEENFQRMEAKVREAVGRRAAQPATTRRPRLVNAAAIGPVMWGILQTFAGDEYG